MSYNTYTRNEQIINISHSDLDGISCTLLLREKYNDVHYINISYNKTNETLLYYYKELDNIRCDKFYITDLNFELDDLILLYKIIKKYNKIQFYYIDHHTYDDKKLLVLDKIKELSVVLIDESKSATLAVYDYLGLDNNKILLYVNVVNAYDLYLTDSKYFKVGLDLNNYFWYKKQKAFAYDFKNFNLKNQKFIDKAKQIRKQAKAHFNNLEQKGLSFEDSGTRVILTDDHLGMINDEYKEDFIIIGTSYCKVSIRTDDKIPEELAFKVKENVINSMKDSVFFISGGGHLRAFGLTFNDTLKNNYKMIFDIMKNIHQTIQDTRG
jgi:hypothetical protein